MPDFEILTELSAQILYKTDSSKAASCFFGLGQRVYPIDSAPGDRKPLYFKNYLWGFDRNVLIQNWFSLSNRLASRDGLYTCRICKQKWFD